MISIETIRKNLNFKKNEIYSTQISRKKYDKIIENFEKISLENLFELSNTFGINYVELLTLCGLSVDDISENYKNHIDNYRLKCVNLISEKNYKQVATEIKYLENKELVFTNVKYLNLWVVLKLYMPQLTNLKSFEKYYLSKNDMEKILMYYHERTKSSEFFLSSQDMQVLSNIHEPKYLPESQYLELYKIFLKKSDLITENSILYEYFLHFVCNGLYLSCTTNKPKLGEAILKYYKQLKPKIPENKIRLDLLITIKIFEDIMLLGKTNNSDYLLSVIHNHETLLDFGCDEALDICDDLVQSVLHNNPQLLKKYESTLLQRERLRGIKKNDDER